MYPGAGGGFLAVLHYLDALELTVGREYVLALELLLECGLFYFGAKSGSLALMCEIGSVDGIAIIVERYVPQMGPQSPAP